MQNQPSMETVQKLANAGGVSNKAYVEAFIEYRGPQQKWAGPTNFLLHVVAKDAGVAKITVTPSLFATPRSRDQDGTTAGRTLASLGMAGENARKQMLQLATAMQGEDAPFSGCLSPVKVRLISADGAIFEKEGCRGSTGWPKVASESVSGYITAMLGGGTPTP
jgi:hypothetical protein